MKHKKTYIRLIALFLCMVVDLTMTSCQTVRACEIEEAGNEIDWTGQGFVKMKTTAYICGHHTAMGVPVHNGICAVSPDHLGDVAIIYTTDGGFLGYYYCCDTGGTDAIRNGYVIDVYRSNLTQATNYMRITHGAIYVKFVSGKG